MKRKAQQWGGRIRKTMTRKALVIMLLAGAMAVLAGVAAWTHTVYAAKVRAEETARKQAATLEQVMAKLDRMQSQMQAQADLTNAKLETLRYANAKLAAYVLRTNLRASRIERAVAYLPASPVGGGSGIIKKADAQIQAQICGNLDAIKGEIKWAPEVEVKGHAEGGVGVDVAGDGAKASVKVNAKSSLDGSVSSALGLGVQVCYQFPPLAVPGPAVDTQALTDAVQSTATQVATKMSAFLTNHPAVVTTALPNSLDSLTTFKANVTKETVLNAIQDPAQTLNNFSGLLQNLPLPGNLSELAANPAAFLPQPSDLTPEALCASPAALGTGLLSVICPKIPPAFQSLDNVSTFLGGFTNLNLSGLQTRVTNLEAGLTSTCSSLNDKLATIDNTTIAFPSKTLTSPLGFVTGVNWNGLSGDPVIGVTKSFPSVTLPPLSANPFQLPAVQCPSF